MDYYIDIVNYVGTARWQDTVLGLACVVTLLLARALNRTGWFKPLPRGSQGSRAQMMFNRLLSPTTLKIVDKTVWFACTARNAIVVLVCLVLAMLLDPDLHDCDKEPSHCVFSLTGTIKAGLPAFQPPPFSVRVNVINNTYNSTEYPDDDHHLITGFNEMVATLGPAIIIIPLIAILESVAIAKAFGKKCFSPYNYFIMHCISWRQTCGR